MLRDPVDLDECAYDTEPTYVEYVDSAEEDDARRAEETSS